MELDNLLGVFDNAAANLSKLERVWEKAREFMPSGPSMGSDPEYEDLRRQWNDLLVGLPPIHGWTITDGLPDIDELGREFLDYAEIGELPASTWAAIEAPASDLSRYHYLLNKARRRAVRDRLEQLMSSIEKELETLLEGVDRNSSEVLSGTLRDQIINEFKEIERLMGNTIRNSPRWGDLHRHLSFGLGQDWHDIRLMDWPSIKPDIIAAGQADLDPVPVPEIDLGIAAVGKLTGSATIALHWERLDDTGFERLVYDIFRHLDKHQNVDWLQRTRAPDRGRDLSCERVTEDGAGGTRVERVIVQAKHWRTKSVGLHDISANVDYMSLLSPPVVRILVIVTSGTFTFDAIEWAERHNAKGNAPMIELWSHSRLESILTTFPELVAEHGLR